MGLPAGPAGGRDGASREGVQQSLLEDFYLNTFPNAGFVVT